MQRITSASALPLFDIAVSRRIEAACAQALPPHTLMRRAGLAVARLAMAIAPHARRIWIVCGPGNNGGDGLEAAVHLHTRGFAPIVTPLFEGDAALSRLPEDARDALRRAQTAGVAFGPAPAQYDLAIDAVLGLGATRAPEGAMAGCLARMNSAGAPLLCVDLPSGLDADTGQFASRVSLDRAPCNPAGPTPARYCLSLLTLKPGLFTAQGRDAAGQIWFDGLGCTPPDGIPPAARLPGAPIALPRPHASHKGSWGDVAVLGGAPGMRGAALLAGRAALAAGAGRVYVALLDPQAPRLDPGQPALMLRPPESLDWRTLTAVCGCGGGEAVRSVLPRLLAEAPRLVLDADALNAIAVDSALQKRLRARAAQAAADSAANPAHSPPQQTVLTPHPLEAARLLHTDVAQVQADRLAAARTLADQYACTVVLKGSGSIIAAPGQTPVINPTGNARLATAGTGDVLAGMIGAALAANAPAFEAAYTSVWRHGALADRWPADRALNAGALAYGQWRV
ncbi:MAG: NAD(P)H-hydrate dehydratase [Burkholderiaceae bacterium]|jgi:hydroxyethylthiazole kinase-like uncharacterized protein yjeF|nr:NAD(P)H-hydrate dehydratase [Burkholderiaceae bacterium]